ncbi:hypothetical protein ADIARSV_4240 [Arcticibacter svalbardensis MN12-7]|uniref:Uncharacterized protein n=1 Tax=Arcticibacter svalbardensis MN12-7 TaxID=1150600 RepID=R9GLY8_9SPHI|nr:hypothetical protein ADIARSV_4240 [Arcticibacter svalbardensis MN12-7]
MGHNYPSRNSNFYRDSVNLKGVKKVFTVEPATKYLRN